MHKSHTPLCADEWSRLDARLRTADEDRWLSSRYAASPQRRALIALYAFNYELAKVRTVVREPGLGAIRFQWWHDALDEMETGQAPRRHEVVRALVDADLPTTSLRGLIDGHEAAYEAGDRALEPEPQLMALAVTQLAPDIMFDEPALAELAAAYAAARRGDDVGAMPARRSWPTVIRPALAHAALNHCYGRDSCPGPLTKRWRIFRAILSGWV